MTTMNTSSQADQGTPQAAIELSEEDALRADIYGLLGELMRQPPDAELLDWLAGLDLDADGTPLTLAWQGLSQAAQTATADTLERAHFRHLVGVIQGDITPYASWYRQGELMEAALLELRQDLRALGIERAANTPEPEDHLAALCEVMAMLVTDATKPRQAHFFFHHLAPWAPQCWGDLAKVDTTFYAALGDLGRIFMESEAARLQESASQSAVRIVSPTQ